LAEPRLTLVIPSLAPGGAERVMARLANHWAVHGWQVTLITLNGRIPDFYQVRPEVARSRLELEGDSANPLQAVARNVRRVLRLRAAIGQSAPDVVLSFMDRVNVLVLLATVAMRVRVLVSERIDPAGLPIDRVWDRLRRWIYPRAAMLVVQTEAARGWAHTIMPAAKVSVIANPLEHAPEAADDPLPERDDAPFILAAGRLEWQKGFDLLLDAFARIAPAHASWRLRIAGEGSQRGALEARIAAQGLTGRVQLLGVVPDLPRLMRRAGVFVLSSRAEGFPNVLLEAMDQGACVVSFDCPSGPGEIVDPGKTGMLVPNENVDALAGALERVMRDPALRRMLGGAAAAQVRERFSLPSVARAWEEVLRGPTTSGPA